jgi:membrane protease YdiL (CAAX protease family)
MITLLFFFIYLVVALILTALLYLPVFQVLNAIWEVRPDRVFYRMAMVIAILGFWPYLKLLSINKLDALGYSLARTRFLRSLAVGMVIGVVIMAVHAALLVLLGSRVIEPGNLHFSDLIESFMTGLISGILVALIEETFFRGAMYHHMRCYNNALTVCILTSLFYAVVHFTRPPLAAGSLYIDWSSGFVMLSGMLYQFKDFSAIADSFIALFAAGLLLGLVRERTGNLAFCIGIHAGWVLMIKLTREVTNADTNSPAAFLIGSYDNVIGWAATGVLVAVTVGYWRLGPAANQGLGDNSK